MTGQYIQELPTRGNDGTLGISWNGLAEEKSCCLAAASVAGATLVWPRTVRLANLVSRPPLIVAGVEKLITRRKCSLARATNPLFCRAFVSLGVIRRSHGHRSFLVVAPVVRLSDGNGEGCNHPRGQVLSRF